MTKDLASWRKYATGKLGSTLEADLIAEAVLGRPRAWLIAHGDVRPEPEMLQAMQAMLQRRQAGEPMAYITGSREFYGREFQVSPAVLIPRPETEHLVEFALGLGLSDTTRVADIGTGSGCIILTLAAERPGWECCGTDVSTDALAVASRNRKHLGLERVKLVRGDALEPLAGQTFDLIVSNPPYIGADDPHLQQGDLRHEPEIALATNGDGLEVIKRLITGAPALLAPGGWLAVEHGYDQADQVRKLFTQTGYPEIHQIRDLAGIERICAGKMGFSLPGQTDR
ncbi:MAG: peptide chain release factor N(5)-glutamine methyltransferase [Wenzhouxiangella sp.]